MKDIAEAVGAKQRGSGSKYITIEAKNGRIVTIRLSNHNAAVRNFDNNGEPEGVSIVVAGTPNNGIENNGDAHVVEFFYSEKQLRKANDKYAVRKSDNKDVHLSALKVMSNIIENSIVG